MEKSKISSSSFRDPSGFVYRRNGVLYRQINFIYKNNFDLLISSGLYKKLQKEKLLISHSEVDLKYAHDKNVYKVIKPELVPFISYPYGWSFSMLKDAALLTLRIQKIALEYGMGLKDASAFNIQFVDGNPIFIDTLSFEKYEDGSPWVAYRQFCQHFLAPLSLMAHTDIRLNQLLKIYMDGIPLDLASKLLPKKTYLNFSMLSHIHVHSRSQNKWADKQISIKEQKIKISKLQLSALIDNLYSSVENLELKKTKTEWGDYYNFTNYDTEAFKDKGGIVKKMIKMSKPKTVWDLGANDGYFSRIAADYGSETVAFDIDPIAVEKNYLRIKKNNEKNILPILLDLTNPTSSYGWANEERDSLVKRGPADVVMALALIHHLAIGNNLPFYKIADFLSKICGYLIIEFVPKKDSQVKKLLASREDIFPDYSQENFEKIFNKYYKFIYKNKVKNSLRTIYLYKKI
jgi:23S rRNA U2552 (ribose-2'-O)-methylase RlmE/FtsJ